MTESIDPVSPRPSAGLARWVKDPYCGLSHAGGAVAALVGLIFLLVFTTGGAFSYVGLSVYGVSMIALFTASALAHSLHVGVDVEDRLNRLDYACIFFLIAGTYTPLCLTVLRGPWGYSLLAVAWTMGIAGGAVVLLTRVKVDYITPLYVPMGWLIVIAAAPLIRLMPTGALLCLIAGGLIYSFGAVVFVLKKPKLWPGRFGYHDLWHTMVLAGAGCHFIAVTTVAM